VMIFAVRSQNRARTGNHDTKRFLESAPEGQGRAHVGPEIGSELT
jgi:hypothetical protein